jgi:uncharacterized membrane protein
MHFLTLSGLAGTCWAMTTTIEKHYLLKKFSSEELFFYRHLFLVIFFLILFSLNFKKKLLKKTINLKNKNLGLNVFLIFYSLLVALGMYLFLASLKSPRLSNVLTLSACVWITLPIILSYMFFGENINVTQLIGIIAILFGIYMVNLNE